LKQLQSDAKDPIQGYMSRLGKLCGQLEDQEHFLLNLRHHQESSNSVLQQMKYTDRTPFKYFRTYFNVFLTCLTELAAQDIKPFLLHWTSMPHHTQGSGYETILSSTAALILSHHIVDRRYRPWMGWHRPVLKSTECRS